MPELTGDEIGDMTEEEKREKFHEIFDSAAEASDRPSTEKPFRITEEWPTPAMAGRLLVAVMVFVAAVLAGAALWPLIML